jgi:hypothetical protein
MNLSLSSYTKYSEYSVMTTEQFIKICEVLIARIEFLEKEIEDLLK